MSLQAIAIKSCCIRSECRAAVIAYVQLFWQEFGVDTSMPGTNKIGIDIHNLPFGTVLKSIDRSIDQSSADDLPVKFVKPHPWECL